jgi:hypothetical protein
MVRAGVFRRVQDFSTREVYASTRGVTVSNPDVVADVIDQAARAIAE